MCSFFWTTLYVSVGIVGLLHVWARQCTSTSSLQNSCVFESQNAWFHDPMLLSADTMNNLHQRTRLSSPLKQGSNWQHQLRLALCTRDTLWHQRYVTTSKEYLINCHIFVKYFELVVLQLQLVKILCKVIIIWVNYEKKNKNRSFYETQCILHFCFWQPFVIFSGCSDCLWTSKFVREKCQVCIHYELQVMSYCHSSNIVISPKYLTTTASELGVAYLACLKHFKSKHTKICM